jgi:hypothetical protein
VATKRQTGSGKADPRKAISELFRNPELKMSEIGQAYASDRIRPLFEAAGSTGGKTRAQNMTPEARKASADKAIRARWAKYRRDNGLPAKPGDEEFLT